MATVHASDMPPRVTGTLHRFAYHPRRWVEYLSRLGLVVRGIIYFVPGVLALEWAAGRPHRTMSQAGTIDIIGHQPLGRLLLAVVAVGLAGYSAWGLVRAVFDPLQQNFTELLLWTWAGVVVSESP